jgi:hypothetical protein
MMKRKQVKREPEPHDAMSGFSLGQLPQPGQHDDQLPSYSDAAFGGGMPMVMAPTGQLAQPTMPPMDGGAGLGGAAAGDEDWASAPPPSYDEAVSGL